MSKVIVDILNTQGEKQFHGPADRWGVDDKGYFWLESDEEDLVSLTIYPLVNIAQVALRIPKTLVEKEEA